MSKNFILWRASTKIMFQRLHELSALFPEKELWQRLNEGMPAEYNRQFALCFSEQGQWREVKTTILNESNHDDIIYRSGPSNGTDLTPCCKLATNTANRLLKAAKNLANYTHLPANKCEQLQASIQAFEEQADEIWQQVESKVQSAGIDGKTKRGFVCWVIGSQPVYEWEETKTFLTEQFLEPFAKGGIRQGNCLICGQSPTEVFGNFNILTCYNLDKRGSIAGGFVEETAHRNFPVCRSCAVAVAEAFTFAESYLTSHMAGQSYMILPYASTPTIREELRSYFQKKPERFQLEKTCDLVSQELEWLEEFSEQGDQIALALIFFHAENNAWRIQAELQQILPSRLHELQHAAKELADAPDLVIL